MSDVAQAQDAVTADAVVTGAVDAAVLDDAYADVTRAPLQAGSPAGNPRPGKSPGANGEVTILAKFDWNPMISEEEELQHFLNGRWHPSYKDYEEITGVSASQSPRDFIALMGMIADYKAKSVRRLNFWTHSNKNLIGISGFIIPSDVTFEYSVDVAELRSYTEAGRSFTIDNKTFTLEDVRRSFSEDGLFVLYGCNAAFDPTTLLTALRDLFQVAVVGFRTENVYCPPNQTGKGFVRAGEKVGVKKDGFQCAKDATRDWRSLITDVNAVRVNKSSSRPSASPQGAG